MSSSSPATEKHAGSTSRTWHEIEGLVEEVARRSREPITPEEYYRGLLGSATRAIGGVGGAAWLCDADGGVRLAEQVNLEGLGISPDGEGEARHAKLAEEIAGRDAGRVIAGERVGGEAFDLVLSPVTVDGRAVGVIELVVRGGASPKTQAGYLELAGAMAELAADYHRERQRRELLERAAGWGEFEGFARAVQRKLELDPTAMAIANEGRRVLGCGRVTVLEKRGRRCRVLAVSGLETIDRRSDVVRSLEQLAAGAAAAGEALWCDESETEIPGPVEPLVNRAFDLTRARSLVVVPLFPEEEEEDEQQRKAEPVGVLVIEQFDAGRFDAEARQRVEAVGRLAAPALANAVRFQRLPLRRVAGVLERARPGGRPGWWTGKLAVLAVLAGIAAALVLVPADFDVEVRGQAQPKVRRDVFAPHDGVVEEVGALHGKEVEANDVVVTMRQSELDQEFTRVLGELRTAQQELAAVQASRTLRVGSAEVRREQNDLSAEEERLKEEINSLNEQLDVLRAKQDDLKVRSPITGRVLTWHVEETLLSRPVERGTVLLTVADASGPWVLELDVPDEDIGYVLEAEKELGTPLEVSFHLATDPGVTHRGTVESVAMSTKAEEAEGPTVRVKVAIEREEVPGLRPGASVRAKIHCGRRALGYVWFHDLFNAVRGRLLF